MVPVQLEMSAGIRIPLDREYPNGFIDGLKQMFTFSNPEYFRAARYSLTPPERFVVVWAQIDGYLEVPRGNLRGVIDYFHKHRISVQLVDQSISAPIIRPTCTTKPLPSILVNGVSILSEKRFSICVGVLGGGALAMAASLIVDREEQTLIVVKRKHQLYVWRNALMENTDLRLEDIGLVGDRHDEFDRPVVVAIDRTLYKQPWRDFGFLIIDRCELANLKIFFKIVRRFNGKYMLGISYLQRREDGLGKLMRCFLGDIGFRVEGINSGTGGGPLVNVHPTGFTFFGDEYDVILVSICDHIERNKRIVADVLASVAGNKKRVMVVSTRNDHLKKLQELLADQYRIAEIISGRTSDGRVEKISDEFNKGKLQVLLTTNKSVDVADINQVDGVFVCAPFKYQETAAAIMGVLKSDGVLYEYLDDHPFCIASMEKRVDFYRRMGARVEK